MALVFLSVRPTYYVPRSAWQESERMVAITHAELVRERSSAEHTARLCAEQREIECRREKQRSDEACRRAEEEKRRSDEALAACQQRSDAALAACQQRSDETIALLRDEVHRLKKPWWSWRKRTPPPYKLIAPVEK